MAMDAIETPFGIEPMTVGDEIPRSLADACMSLRDGVADLGARLPAATKRTLADLVRITNCYYSNLIEGHATKPRDIRAALAGDGDRLPSPRRDLALEAAAHVRVQREVDRLHSVGGLERPTTVRFVRWLHREFYRDVPPALRRVVREDGTVVEVAPGEFRSREDEDVTVGRHHPPSSSRVEAFMGHFEDRMRFSEVGGTTTVTSVATAHHRFAYVHPFVDGNGRVARLMSHAMVVRAGLGAEGLWSVSRGLARGLREKGEYHRMMAHADSPRQGDRDGRGNLSERAMLEFTEWFVHVMADQVRFMRAAFDFEGLGERLERVTHDLTDDPRAVRLVRAVHDHGTLRRGGAPIVLEGVSSRTARTVMSDLVRRGLLASDTPRGDLRIGVPLDHKDRMFPGLLGDGPITAPEPEVPAFMRRDT